MPIPTRPVDGAEIATEWGQYVHDYGFAPAGCNVSGGAVTMAAAAANSILPIDTAIDDPGGYMDAAGDRVEIPTGGEGLYLIRPFLHFVDAATTDEAVGELLLNGANVGRVGPIESLGATNAPLTGVFFFDLVAGDQFQVRARQVGSGTRGDVSIVSLFLVRMGAELGAPTS